MVLVLQFTDPHSISLHSYPDWNTFAKKKKDSKLKIVKCILTQTPPHPEDGDINRSELIAERAVVLSGLDVEQQVSHCIHCDVGDHRERIPAHERELRCVLRIRRSPGRVCKTDLYAVSSTLACSQLTSSGMRDRWEI